MARKKREESKIGVYHIMLRGENPLFLEDGDYETFLAILKEKVDPKNVKILAYAFSKTRVHMVLEVKDGSIGLVLKPVCTSYARYCNRTRDLNGKLFYDRFKSEPINSKDELLDVVAFINFIAKLNKNEKFSSLKNPLVAAKDSKVTVKSTGFTKLFIEDYDALSKKELESYISAAGGVTAKEFKTLSPEKQAEIADRISKDNRLLKSRIFEAFGVKKPQTAKPAKKTSTKPEKTSTKPEKTPAKPEKTPAKPKKVSAKPKKVSALPKKAESVETPKQEKRDMSVWLL